MSKVRIPALAALAAAALLCSPAGAVAKTKDLKRATEPVVLEGAELGELAGIAPDRLVAFRYRRTRSGRHEKWVGVPVQVDERKLTDFGSAPPSNGTPGSEGTVYGTSPIGHGVLQYADPATFVGPDPDSTLDADDEVALMASDAGDRARKRKGRPRGVRGKGALRLKLADPIDGARQYVYLYQSKGERQGDAGTDYVDYEFRLLSGDYHATYDRADGPNPESSAISTDAYEIGFSDRWYFDSLAIKAGGASPTDILDGYKFGFAPGNCGRSEATFNDGEGAFVANLDGPVRAIRAYIGANSGPLTQRTHRFYADRHEIVTDLRVHPISGLLTYHDLSAAGRGMSYLNSANQAPVAVDGAADPVSAAIASWHLWTGGTGSLFAAERLDSSFADAVLAAGSGWYLDNDVNPPTQCWGDDDALGQAGLRTTASIPNTDPRATPTEHFSATATQIFTAPGAAAADAELWSSHIDAPLSATTKAIGRR